MESSLTCMPGKFNDQVVQGQDEAETSAVKSDLPKERSEGGLTCGSTLDLSLCLEDHGKWMNECPYMHQQSRDG